jgi:tetratricopeptide (TPR) repeat protein
MSGKKSNEELDLLIHNITADTDNYDHELWAFRQVFEDDVTMPHEAFAVGEPVTVLAIDYDGNERRGLTARIRREDGSEHVIAACDLLFPEGSTGERYVAAYRRWLGIEPYPQGAVPKRKPERATADDIDLAQDVTLIALAVKERAITCRFPGRNRVVTLRATRLWDVAPGELITVAPRKMWHHAGYPHLSGEIKAWRLDIPALGLTPLKLEERGMWDPRGEYWGEPGEPIEDWAQPIIDWGPRPVYVMEEVTPGEDPLDPDTDPILEAVDLKEAGQYEEAHRTLMKLLAIDLRCLDAHAHLGTFAFKHDPEMAIRHYEVGVRIGELSLGERFNGVLLSLPFLRCLRGYGLALWRLGRLKEAGEVFTRMLWLNPRDNQGVRFPLREVQEGKAWHD